MTKLTVVERLLKHLDDNHGSFYRLWKKTDTTPSRAVAEYRDEVENAAYDLECDDHYLSEIINGIIDDLSPEQVFEFGNAIMNRMAKYRDMY